MAPLPFTATLPAISPFSLYIIIDGEPQLVWRKEEKAFFCSYLMPHLESNKITSLMGIHYAKVTV
jgi:hypothetical protein